VCERTSPACVCWKGGPRLQGEPDTPEFVARYNAAVVTKPKIAAEGRLLRLLQEYQRSQDFLGLRDKTRSDYITHIKKIEVKFGDMPTKALADPRAHGVFMDWRDELALKSLRGADYTCTVLAAVLAWAKDRGKMPVSPCERGGRLYRGTRVDHVWSIEARGSRPAVALASSPGAFAGAMDRAAPRRPIAASVVGL
jgi:hypothetical protein